MTLIGYHGNCNKFRCMCRDPVLSQSLQFKFFSPHTCPYICAACCAHMFSLRRKVLLAHTALMGFTEFQSWFYDVFYYFYAFPSHLGQRKIKCSGSMDVCKPVPIVKPQHGSLTSHYSWCPAVANRWRLTLLQQQTSYSRCGLGATSCPQSNYLISIHVGVGRLRTR